MAVAVAVAVPLVAAAGWALAARVSPAGPATETPLRAPSSAGSVGAVGPPANDLLAASDSPAVRPMPLLQALSDRRALALVRRDTGALNAVHVDGSPSAMADQRVVATLRDSGARWEGLRAEVGEARLVSGSSRVAVVRARVSWTAYVVVDSRGARHQRPAEGGEVLDFRLEHGAAGWRFVSISAARAS